MKENLNKSITKINYLKIFLIFYSIIFIYILYLSYIKEEEFSGYDGRFVAFIETLLNPLNKISLDFISPMPLLFPAHINTALSLQVQSLIQTEKYFPFMIILFLILHYVTDISSKTLMVSPIGGIIVPILYICLVNKFIKRNDFFYLLISIFGILALIVRRSVLTGFYVAPSCFILFLTTLILIKCIYDDENRSQNSILFVLCLFSLAHYWHSVLFMTLFVIVSLEIISYLIFLFFKTPTHKITAFGLMLLGIIISASFTHLWENQIVVSGLIDVDFFYISEKIIDRVMGAQPFQMPYIYNFADTFWGWIFLYSLLLTYILEFSFLIIMLLRGYAIFRAKISEGTPIEKQELIVFSFGISILFAEGMQIIFYLKSESVNLFYAFLYPLFGGAILYNFKKNGYKIKNLSSILLISLIILSSVAVISLNFSDDLGRNPATKYDDTKYNFNWIYGHINIQNNRKEIILGDFSVIHKYIQRLAKVSPLTDLKIYNFLGVEVYGILVGDILEVPAYLKGCYVEIDHATMQKGLPIDIRGSRGFLLVPQYNRINKCVSQDKLFMDNHISIYLLR